MRPEKIEVLLEMAETQSKLSPDKNTKVGAILVDKDGGTLLSSYNGYISGAPDSKLPNAGVLKKPYIIHAEMNSILRAAKKGIKLEDAILICTHSPCINCTRALYQVGIKTVYYRKEYKDMEENSEMKDLTLTVRPVGNYFKLTMEAAK